MKLAFLKSSNKEEKIKKWFVNKKGKITDNEFHDFAELIGIEPDKAEGIVYNLYKDSLKYKKVDEKAEGLRIEKEHKGLIDILKKDVANNGKITLSDDEIYGIIRDVHRKEDNDYYSKLLAFVET